MTVKITKPAINLREKLAELEGQDDNPTYKGLTVEGTVTATGGVVVGNALPLSFDLDGDGYLAAEDAIEYMTFSRGAGTAIADHVVASPSWNPDSAGAVYDNAKFHLSVLQGNSADALQAAGGATRDGYGDSFFIGNTHFDTTSSSINGFGASGPYVNIVAPDTVFVDIAGTSRLAVNSTGVDVTGDIAVSGGVYLGDTGSANHLDDYETGTWTPLNSTVANVYHARYTKIGNLVTINTSFRLNTGQTTQTITLPFLPINDSAGGNTTDAENNRYSGAASFFDKGTSQVNLMPYHQGNQGSAIYFVSQSYSGAQSWVTTLSDGFGAIAVSMTYQTSA